MEMCLVNLQQRKLKEMFLLLILFLFICMHSSFLRAQSQKWVSGSVVQVFPMQFFLACQLSFWENK